MNRPSTIDDRLTAWLDEGPSTGPDDLLTAAHARARSMRQRPGWLLALKGETMDTTWRARPVLVARLAFVLLTVLLVIALGATTLVVGSRLIGRIPRDSRLAVAPVIPTGPEALLAFSSLSSGKDDSDLFVVRADGIDGRRILSDDRSDWSPAWSPDGSEIALYSDLDGRIQLRVVSGDGTVRVLDDSPGCFQSHQAPAWSPDGRFLLYVVDRLPDDGACEFVHTDVFVVPADGGAPGRRLLAAEHTEFTSVPDWSGDSIVVAANDGETAALWVAEVTDPDQPWDLVGQRIDAGFPDLVAFFGSRWSPDGSSIATTYIPAGTGFGTALVYRMGDTAPRSILDDPTRDQIQPDWGPDGTWFTVLEHTALVTDHLSYHLVVVGADGSGRRTIETPDLNGNVGPALVSPDGTLVAVREERDDSAAPGDILIVRLEDGAPISRVGARIYALVSWQPVVNAANPATNAPVGLPTP